MFRSIALKIHYRQCKAYLRHQTQTGEDWQSRCYRGDDIDQKS